MFVFRAKRGGHRLFDKRRKSGSLNMNDVRIVLTFSDITKSKASLRLLSVAFYGCKGNTFSRHRQIFMQKSLLSPSPLRGHPFLAGQALHFSTSPTSSYRKKRLRVMTRDRYMSGFDITLTPLFSRVPLPSQHLQPLLTIRRGFRPLPKPLANLWQGDVIDFGDWSPSSKFLYGSHSFRPSGEP